jgi:hypothetical protein
VRQAEHILRARIAAIGGCANHRHGLGLFAFLKQHQPVIVSGFHMAKPSGLFIKLARAGVIDLDPAAQPVGLRQIEQRIRIARRRRALPFDHSAGEIASAPRVDAFLHVGQRRRCDQRKRACGQCCACRKPGDAVCDQR